MILTVLLSLLPDFLSSMNQDLEQIQKKLSEFKGKELSVLEEIEKIDYEIILNEKEIVELKAKERLFSTLSKEKEKELKEVRKNFEKEKGRLKSLLFVIYMSKFINPIQILLEKSKDLTFTDFARIIYIFNLSKERLKELEISYNKVKKRENEFKRIEENYKRIINSKRSKLLELNQKKKEKKKFIENLRKERNKYLSLLREMEKASEAISKTISKVEPSQFSLELGSIREKKGMLPWPVDGKVVQKFGLVKNKKYNTFVKNIGIIFSPKREIVKVVWWGKVIFADYFEGYGNVVIIEHQDRVYSIYGYLGEILVQKGQKVKTGQEIAKVGSSGLAKEKALYFEIREGNEPKNPLQWLLEK